MPAVLQYLYLEVSGQVRSVSIVCCAVCALLVLTEAQLSDHVVHASWQPRMSSPHRALYLQTGM